jgi:hypothetical protein
VTAAELSLLKSLAQVDVVTFMPEDNTAAARTRYEATVESLRELQKAGWVELAVHGGRQGGAAVVGRVMAVGESGAYRLPSVRHRTRAATWARAALDDPCTTPYLRPTIHRQRHTR